MNEQRWKMALVATFCSSEKESALFIGCYYMKKFKVLKLKIRNMQTHFIKTYCEDDLSPTSIDKAPYMGNPFYFFYNLPFLYIYFLTISSHWNWITHKIKLMRESHCFIEGFKTTLYVFFVRNIFISITRLRFDPK